VRLLFDQNLGAVENFAGAPEEALLVLTGERAR